MIESFNKDERLVISGDGIACGCRSVLEIVRSTSSRKASPKPEIA